jgi:hypothetical protein
LFRSANGQNGIAISPNQLKETIRQWLIATGEVIAGVRFVDGAEQAVAA